MSDTEGRVPTRSGARAWDPLAELGSLADWSPMREYLRGGSRLGAGEATRLLPAIDVSESDDRYVVTAELPGTRREDVTLEVHDGVLTLRGEKRNEREERKEHRRYVERGYGTFSRSFTLPANVDEGRISASFDNGVLTVELPKAPEARPRTVQISS